jgi:hypothetical protein
MDVSESPGSEKKRFPSCTEKTIVHGPWIKIKMVLAFRGHVSGYISP